MDQKLFMIFLFNLNAFRVWGGWVQQYIYVYIYIWCNVVVPFTNVLKWWTALLQCSTALDNKYQCCTSFNIAHRARINSWIELELMINSIQFSMNWIGIELKDFELELNWNWKPQLIGIDQFNQFIFNSIPHFTRLNFFCMPYYGNCSVTSNTM